MLPLEGFNKPLTNLVIVDFPQPDGPTIAVKPPFLTEMERFFITGSKP